MDGFGNPLDVKVDGLIVYNDYLYHWWNAVGKARNCKELPGLTAGRR